MRYRLRIFEVDDPATQAWKPQRLAEADISSAKPYGMASRRRLRSGAAILFTWLGVVPYLTEEAAFATLGYIGRQLGGDGGSVRL